MELRHLENLAAVAELGTPALRAPSVPQDVHPARETTASGDHQLSFLRAGLGELDVR